jgi:hypothetical protein
MAVYKIFPEKTATIFSYYSTLNTGLDEIGEISTFDSIDSTNEVSRFLIKFPQDEIRNVWDNLVSGNPKYFLKMYLANASELPLTYDLYCHPLAADWNVGTGRLANSPITTDGVSWEYKDTLGGNTWFSLSFPVGTTGSYASGSTAGGGLWYTSSQYVATQSFSKSTSKDIELDITNAVSASMFPVLINNYGFIIKHSNNIEFTTASKFETKYFTGNTHTIYPPCLEIRWDDSYYTSSLTQISSTDVVATLGNNVGEYQQDSVKRFRINVRDKYPARAFQTSSVYLNNKILPQTSYWAIKDLDTEEVVVDFDTTYTKVSADNTGNYFDVYMNGLEPERYYQILIKTIISGSTLILNDNYYFKVVR